jgi:hypothetical protein
MGRKRTKTPAILPDRIQPTELAHWMRVNCISPNTLARELGLTYATVQAWLRGYSPAPRWLEQYINLASMLPKSKMPLYGKRWEDNRQEPASKLNKRQFDITPPPLDSGPYDDEDARHYDDED